MAMACVASGSGDSPAGAQPALLPRDPNRLSADVRTEPLDVGHVRTAADTSVNVTRFNWQPRQRDVTSPGQEFLGGAS
jgi:hypothetical protein